MQLRSICEDLKLYLNEIHGLYLDSISGFSLINQYLETESNELVRLIGEVDLELLNERSISHKRFFGSDFAASGIHHPTVAELRSRTAINDHNYDMVGKMCIVYLFSFWEMNLRKRIAKAKTIDVKDVIYDYWGDLRLLRNFIVHSSQKTRNELKKSKIFKMWDNDDEVIVTVEYFRRILLDGLRFHNNLYSESFEKRTIRIQNKNAGEF